MKSFTPINLYQPLNDSHPDRNEEVRQFRIMCDLLEEYGCKYWLDWGTLLGAYREGKVIDWDYDLDVSCVIDETDRWTHDGVGYRYQLHLLNLLQKEFYVRFFIENVYISIIPKDYRGFELNHIDIGLHKQDSFRTSANHREFFIDELESIKLNGIEFPCPRHTESFVKMRYGNNWRTPVVGFSPTGNDTPNKPHYTCYTSMVGDFFHDGHQNLLRRCKGLFDKVIVGVHNDQDTSKYKLKPYQSYEQRLQQIKECEFVDEVYENAPYITTDDILDHLQADFVVSGREDPSRISQVYPVNPDRLHLIERTPGVSSREIRANLVS
jgi:cytidyltransferase-like protein